MAVFTITNNVEMKTNASVNINNLLIKVYVIKHLFEIQVIVSVSVINLVTLVSI